MSKDKGASQYTIPLAASLKRLGFTVVIVAEGVAAGEFKKAGYSLYFEGSFDFTREPFEYDEIRMLEDIKPKILVVGHSWPINMERTFGHAANQFGIPVVLSADGPGVHFLSDEKLALVLCDEAYTQALIKRDLGSTVRTVLVGSCAVKEGRELIVSAKAKETISSLRERFHELYLFVGGHPGPTTAELRLLVDALESRPGPWGVIARHHLKFAPNLAGDTGKTYDQVWREILARLGDRVIWPNQGDFSGEELVASADVVFSGRSTLLLTAAARGIRAVSLRTPETLANNKKVLGLDEISAVASGYAVAMEKPTDLERVLREPLPDSSKFVPYDPDLAAKAVQDFLTRNQLTNKP